MRILILPACFLIASQAMSAPEKGEIARNKLIGKWIVKDDKPGAVEASMEFSKDGTAKIVAELGGQPITLKGTYTLKGDQLRISVSFGDNETPNTFTVVQLTSSQLKLVNGEKIPQVLYRDKR